LLVFGFSASLLTLVWRPLGLALSAPAWVLASYFSKVLDIFSQPWAAVTLQNVSWVWLVAYYALLSGVVWYLYKIKKPAFLEY